MKPIGSSLSYYDISFGCEAFNIFIRLLGNRSLTIGTRYQCELEARDSRWDLQLRTHRSRTRGFECKALNGAKFCRIRY